MELLQTDDVLDSGAEVNQYLTFMLDSEEYGVDILKVQEIRGWEEATKIPNSRDFMLGVINLRGSVVPIVDLRKRFELSDTEFSKVTVMILVKVTHNDNQRTIGMVVDSVSDVYTVAEKDLNPAPDIGGAIGSNFVKGLATVDDKMIILLDIDRLINVGVLEDIDAAEKQVTP
jgi:purine-binding chemotaxis protein CheW